MGRRPKARGRDVHGIILLDKPQGLSSNQALQKVKRLFNANRAGHTGTLDPMATGLLPICLGEATKVSAYLTDSNKAYTARVQLGQITDTADAEGEVISDAPIPDDWQAHLPHVLEQFLGEQEQVPPMYSALKVNGQPLYKLAREGIEVERKRRTITIHSLNILNVGDTWFDMAVACSKGTYIRSLAEDMAQALHSGAHLTQLRRTQVEPYTLDNALTLEYLKTQAEQGLDGVDAHLMPVQSALPHWPVIEVDDAQASNIKDGKRLACEQANGWYCVMHQAVLLTLAEVIDGVMYSRRLMHIDKSQIKI